MNNWRAIFSWDVQPDEADVIGILEYAYVDDPEWDGLIRAEYPDVAETIYVCGTESDGQGGDYFLFKDLESVSPQEST